MTISRGQMNRQLYMGGGIMDVVPREQYGFGSIFKGVTKAVKKVAGGVKDIASSDLGKAALLAAGAYYAPGFGIKAQGGFGAFGSMLKNKAAGMVPKLLKGKAGTALGITALGGLFGGAMAGKSEEEVESLTRDVPALKSYLTQYYTNLNPELRNQPEKVEQFVNSQIAEYNEGKGGYAMGGRIGYGEGDPDPKIPEQFLEDLKRRKIDELFQRYKRFEEDYEREKAGAQTQEAAMGGRIGYDIGGNAMTASYGYDDAMSETYNNFLDMKKNKQIPIDMDFDEFLRDVVPEMSKMQTEGRGSAAMGGRMQYALGDSASQNAMQASGIEGLPMRQNPKGVQELDLRDNGGFIPPVGIKEKEDDIPAMLSNNEFVFTADAVRGMGDGDVELGAQRMYDQMKTLEEGGRV